MSPRSTASSRASSPKKRTVQRSRTRRAAPARRRHSSPTAICKSDFLLVKPPGTERFVEFRDVFEVDGRPVRDRQDRLTKLFLDDVDTDRVRAIVDESARYNIGNIPRNINTPMLPLIFLQENFQYRFKFKRTRNTSPDLAGLILAGRGNTTAFRTDVEVWVIEYRETREDTVIHSTDGDDFPSAGRFWVEPDTGAVLMSELVMEKGDVRAVIDVSYQSEPLLGMRVPVAMHERYRARSERVEGIATYSKFRQFQVKTDEVIDKPDPDAPPPPVKPPPKPPPPSAARLRAPRAACTSESCRRRHRERVHERTWRGTLKRASRSWQ